MVRIVFGMDELLLTLGFLLQALCVIWIIFYIRNKRESEREVALSDELIEEENGIIVTGSTTTAQTIGRFNHNRDYFIPLRERYGGILEEKEDFIPKKRIKYHTLEEPIEYYSEPIEYYSEDGLIHLEDEDEGCGWVPVNNENDLDEL